MTPDWAIHGARLAALVIVAIAAVTDARKELIPNWLTLPVIVAAPIFWLVVDFYRGGLLSLLGLVACAAVPYWLFRRGAWAGGDVKLFAAVGAVVGGDYGGGIGLGIEALLFTTMAAALYALVRLAWQGKLFRTLGNAFFLPLNPFLPEKWRREITPELMSKVRLGVPALVGTGIAVLLRYPAIWM
jgi:prepilin peptidase CpaA